jgi:molybdopterin synthase sulfur carrier subunit
MRTIKLLATLRDIAGQKEIEIPFVAGSVRDLLTAINQHQPALGEAIWDSQGQLTGRVHILVNGRNIEWLNQLETAITERDQLIFLPPSAGG